MSLPDSISDDWEMDEWLNSAEPHTKSHSGPSRYTVYILPEGKKGAFRPEAGGRRLVMGKGMAGWLLVSTDPSKLLTSMQVVPKMLAAVVRGEDQDASTALVEATAAGAKAGAANARFSGEIEAREVGQPSALRVTLSLLVGCTSDAAHQALMDQNSSGSTPICSRGVVGWEAEEAVGSMMRPLVERLQGTYNLTVDSQVLHYADLAVAPVWDEEHQGYVLKASTMNDFINWRHWSPRPALCHLSIRSPPTAHSDGARQTCPGVAGNWDVAPVLGGRRLGCRVLLLAATRGCVRCCICEQHGAAASDPA